MGRKYAFRDNRQLYFVTITAVGWMDVFIRQEYKDIIYKSIAYCQDHKRLEIHAYCIMTSHIHLIIGSEGGILSDIVRDMKSFTSRHIRKAIEYSKTESRKEWMLELLKRAGINNERNKDFQLWQQHNHPIELSTYEMTQQRLNYIHRNPVEAGFVEKEEEWLDSSAGDYYGVRKGRLELIYI